MPSSPHILRRALLVFWGRLVVEERHREEPDFPSITLAQTCEILILFPLFPRIEVPERIPCTHLKECPGINPLVRLNLGWRVVGAIRHPCTNRSTKSPSWARAPWAPASPRTWPMPVFRPTCSTSFRPTPTARRAIALPLPDSKLRSNPSPPPSSSPRWSVWSPSATSKTTCPNWPKSTGSSKPSSKTSTSSATLLREVDAVRKPGTIITTNTSGLPVAKIAEGFPEDFRRSWFGTHFFNPPRYMRLLELIPTPDADPALMQTRSRTSAICTSARVSCTPRTRPTSSPIASAPSPC